MFKFFNILIFFLFKTIVIIYTILSRSPELKFKQVIELDGFVNQAIEMYVQEKGTNHNGNTSVKTANEKYTFTKEDRNMFFAEKNTSSYISRVCIDCLLKDSTSDNLDLTLEQCKLS